MSARKLVTELTEGDMIDLEDVDESTENQQMWPYELASVESVSYPGHPAGGWLDGYLDNPTFGARAIIYLDNGAVPAIVPLSASFEMDLAMTPDDPCPTCGHGSIAHGARGCTQCSCIDYDPEGDDQ
jgi:hypothetical protein